MNPITPDLVKTVVDGVFAELETLTASRPLLSFAVSALHQLVDKILVARVASKLNPPSNLN